PSFGLPRLRAAWPGTPILRAPTVSTKPRSGSLRRLRRSPRRAYRMHEARPTRAATRHTQRRPKRRGLRLRLSSGLCLLCSVPEIFVLFELREFGPKRSRFFRTRHAIQQSRLLFPVFAELCILVLASQLVQRTRARRQRQWQLVLALVDVR